MTIDDNTYLPQPAAPRLPHGPLDMNLQFRELLETIFRHPEDLRHYFDRWTKNHEGVNLSTISWNKSLRSIIAELADHLAGTGWLRYEAFDSLARSYRGQRILIQASIRKIWGDARGPTPRITSLKLLLQHTFSDPPRFSDFLTLIIEPSKHKDLPPPTLQWSDYVARIIDYLSTANLLKRDLFQRIEADFPEHGEEIWACAKEWGVTSGRTTAVAVRRPANLVHASLASRALDRLIGPIEALRLPRLTAQIDVRLKRISASVRSLRVPAHRGSCKIKFISGEAGMGKMAMACQMLTARPASGHLCLWIKASSLNPSIRLEGESLVERLLKEAFDFQRSTAVSATAPTPHLTMKGLRYALRAREVTIILEDVHLAGDPVEVLLEIHDQLMASRLWGRRLRIVATSRRRPDPQAWHLLTTLDAEFISLPALDQRAAQELFYEECISLGIPPSALTARGEELAQGFKHDTLRTPGLIRLCAKVVENDQGRIGEVVDSHSHALFETYITSSLVSSGIRDERTQIDLRDSYDKIARTSWLAPDSLSEKVVLELLNGRGGLQVLDTLISSGLLLRTVWADQLALFHPGVGDYLIARQLLAAPDDFLPHPRGDRRFATLASWVATLVKSEDELHRYAVRDGGFFLMVISRYALDGGNVSTERLCSAVADVLATNGEHWRRSDWSELRYFLDRRDDKEWGTRLARKVHDMPVNTAAIMAICNLRSAPLIEWLRGKLAVSITLDALGELLPEAYVQRMVLSLLDRAEFKAAIVPLSHMLWARSEDLGEAERAGLIRWSASRVLAFSKADLEKMPRPYLDSLIRGMANESVEKRQHFSRIFASFAGTSKVLILGGTYSLARYKEGLTYTLAQAMLVERSARVMHGQFKTVDDARQGLASAGNPRLMTLRLVQVVQGFYDERALGNGIGVAFGRSVDQFVELICDEDSSLTMYNVHPAGGPGLTPLRGGLAQGAPTQTCLAIRDCSPCE